MFATTHTVSSEPDSARIRADEHSAGRTVRSVPPTGRNRMSQVRRRLRVLQVERAMPGRGLAA
jgi:hypothetical protein